MQFDTLFADTHPILFEQFGESATYTPKSGSVTALTCLPGTEKIEVREVGNERRRCRVLTVTIITDPASEYGGVAVPLTNATFTLASEIWAVDQIINARGQLVDLVLVRHGAAEVSRPDYRTRMGS